MGKEIGIYADAFRTYWPLQISLGFLLTWLYLFPFQGNVVWDLAAGLAINAHPLVALFLTGVAAGLIGAAVVIRFRPSVTRWLSLAALPCMAVSTLLLDIPETWWWLIFTAMGFFGGVMISTWGYFYSTTVPANRKTRVLASGSLLSGLFSLAVSLPMADTLLFYQILAYSLMLAGFPLAIMLRYHRHKTNVPPSGVNNQAENRPLTFRTALPFLVIIFIASLVSGLAQVVVNFSTGNETLSWMAPGWIPFFVLLLVAGTIGDRLGRRRLAYIGVILAGLGFMAAGFLQLPLRMFIIHVIALGGYAFLDTFCWVMPGDLSRGKNLPFIYAGFMATYMLSNLAGVLIGEKITQLGSDIELITISLSGLLVIISMLFIPRLRESGEPPAPLVFPAPAADLETSLESFNLTAREKEIARLLLDGVSMENITSRTFIAETTLKSHLRNIYRKAGVKNRLELTLAVLKSPSPTGDQAAVTTLEEK